MHVVDKIVVAAERREITPVQFIHELQKIGEPKDRICALWMGLRMVDNEMEHYFPIRGT